MTTVRFYHLQSQNIEQALPAILEKACEQKHRMSVQMADEKEVEHMTTHLWSYKDSSFLAHGSKKDGNADKQPIWLTHIEENPNNSNVLILTQGVENNTIDTYDLCCEIFDGRNNEAVQSARLKWKDYKDKGFDVTYWHQSETGKWDKKS